MYRQAVADALFDSEEAMVRIDMSDPTPIRPPQGVRDVARRSTAS